MAGTPGLLAPLLGLGLGLMLALSLPGVQAADCGSLGPAERLTFAPAARDRWLAPRTRAPGPLDHLYGTVRRFLSIVQLNPFPTGECALPRQAAGGTGSWPAPSSPSTVERAGSPACPTPIFLPRGGTWRPLQDLTVLPWVSPFSSLSLSFSVLVLRRLH